jgi:hypothetical protein
MAKGQDKGGKDKAQNKDKKKLSIKEKRKMKQDKKDKAAGTLKPNIGGALNDKNSAAK